MLKKKSAVTVWQLLIQSYKKVSQSRNKVLEEAKQGFGILMEDMSFAKEFPVALHEIIRIGYSLQQVFNADENKAVRDRVF